MAKTTKEIPAWLYDRLDELGIISNETRATNVGTSDYSRHLIQPWAIWQEYQLNPWDADIVKRVLRAKQGDPRRLDYEKSSTSAMSVSDKSTWRTSNERQDL